MSQSGGLMPTKNRCEKDRLSDGQMCVKSFFHALGHSKDQVQRFLLNSPCDLVHEEAKRQKMLSEGQLLLFGRVET